MAIAPFAPGKLRASRLNEIINAMPRLLARERRTSNSSTTTTETGVIRLDDIAVTSGHLIQIRTTNLVLGSSVSTDLVVARIRMTADGSTPTTSSTAIGLGQSVASTGVASAIVTEYYPTSDVGLSILLSVARGSGSGNCSISGATTWPITVYIYDLGPDTGDVGTEL